MIPDRNLDIHKEIKISGMIKMKINNSTKDETMKLGVHYFKDLTLHGIMLFKGAL